MKDKIALYISPLSTIGSYYELLDLAYENNIKKVETINCFEFSKPDLSKAKEIKKYADQLGIKFTCVSLAIDLVYDDFKEKIALAKEYAKVAEILGSPYLHHTIVSECYDYEKIKHNKEKFYAQGISAVREIFDYSKALGVQTVIEDQGFLFNGIDMFRRFLNEIDRNIGVVADVGNILFADENIEPFITEFSDKIVNIHLKDFAYSTIQNNDYVTISGKPIKNCILGAGEVNFQEIFKILKAIKYKGNYALECSPVSKNEKQDFQKNLAFAEKLIGEF